ncbi:DNA cytosine methyltransferase [Fimbriiglobus ruber]|uniref:C-5 cytosine-specific DNA methylase n=1 Tax=Fimbriiglobus ruber TaxID=1908690 RepID=A0A225DTZ8_9BACT|nr:DNA cytosine methyltransferase [Fimbriiglobus ruber]OWK42018.1 C-5 cytosine-specific DNA methylase [Fimbriiglobus ruber]
MTETREITHFHLFCGLGGGAKGFNKGQARVGNVQAKFRCLGGIDSDPAAIADFNRLAGTSGTVLDLFSREQYVAFHGKEPPAEWREATSDDIHRAAGNERPHIVFLSAPCKGFSGLLSETRSKTGKYQALNGLTLRGIWLMLEAWKDDPVELLVFENVPRIASRGRQLLDRINALLRHYGYAVAETTHDCGELGGLAQSRKRFLLVARHQEKVPPFLYEPEKRSLRAVGDILGRMPLPGEGRGGPMHRVPSLQWKTWVRLAFVEAGSDWRSLNRLKVVDGKLADYLIVPEYRTGFLGVRSWDETCGTVQGQSLPTNGAFSVADPRIDGVRHNNIFRVTGWDEASQAITAGTGPTAGGLAVADPRTTDGDEVRFKNSYKVIRWEDPSRTITSGHSPSNGGYAVADPRSPGTSWGTKYHVAGWGTSTGTVISSDDHGAYAVADPRTGFADSTHHNVLRVTPWDEHARTVTGSNHPSGGALTVADPRCGLDRGKGDHYVTGGHYGVVPWEASSGAVSGSAGHDNGRWSVADPRLPDAADRLVVRIRSLDGTWHRPFTTMELAALQSLIDPEEVLELDGLSDGSWRERIGNAVPPEAAAAIAGVMGTTLLLAWSGQTFVLSSTPIWVRPVAVALSVQQAEVPA